MGPSTTYKRYHSPLRYPGGKGKVANFIKLLILKNSLKGVSYIEPYAGGASVALSLLAEGYVQHAYINDLNRGIYAFWKYALDQPESLCSRIRSIPISISEWLRQRAIYSDPNSTQLELGFSTFYLNRTNRSGIISRGGVIGGIEQLGRWKMDARFDRERLCERIMNLSGLAPRITLTRNDAHDLLNSSIVTQHSNRLLYLDPPYYVKGSGLYDNFYNHGDHMKICESIRRLPGPWVVSYDAAPQISDMYDGCQAIQYTLGYSASSASKGTEVMFLSDELQLPDVASPANITARHVADALAECAINETARLA